MDNAFQDQPTGVKCLSVVNNQHCGGTACFVTGRSTLGAGVVCALWRCEQNVDFADLTAQCAEANVFKSDVTIRAGRCGSLAKVRPEAPGKVSGKSSIRAGQADQNVVKSTG